MTVAAWALVASVVFTGLWSGLFAMLNLVMHPMLAAMNGHDFLPPPQPKLKTLHLWQFAATRRLTLTTNGNGENRQPPLRRQECVS